MIFTKNSQKEHDSTTIKQKIQANPAKVTVIYMCKAQKKSMSCGTSMSFDRSVDWSWNGFHQHDIASLKKIHYPVKI